MLIPDVALLVGQLFARHMNLASTDGTSRRRISKSPASPANDCSHWRRHHPPDPFQSLGSALEPPQRRRPAIRRKPRKTSVLQSIFSVAVTRAGFYDPTEKTLLRPTLG